MSELYLQDSDISYIWYDIEIFDTYSVSSTPFFQHLGRQSCVAKLSGSWINELAFRTMWSEFEWENKVNINTSITEVLFLLPLEWKSSSWLSRCFALVAIPKDFYKEWHLSRSTLVGCWHKIFCSASLRQRYYWRHSSQRSRSIEKAAESVSCLQVGTFLEHIMRNTNMSIVGRSYKKTGTGTQMSIRLAAQRVEAVETSNNLQVTRTKRRENSLQKMCKRCCGMRWGHWTAFWHFSTKIQTFLNSRRSFWLPDERVHRPSLQWSTDVHAFSLLNHLFLKVGFAIITLMMLA